MEINIINNCAINNILFKKQKTEKNNIYMVSIFGISPPAGSEPVTF